MPDIIVNKEVKPTLVYKYFFIKGDHHIEKMKEAA